MTDPRTDTADGARDARRSLPATCRARSLTWGLALFAGSLTFYVVSLTGLLFSPLWAWLPCAFANGLAIGLLFVVAHDACHGSLTPHRAANRWIGRIAFLPSLHPFSAWARTHNGLHHAWTNLKGRDPVYAPFTLEEFRRLPALRRGMERLYRSPAGLGWLYFIEVWWKHEFFPRGESRPRSRREFQFDRLLVLTYAGASYVVVGLWHSRRVGGNRPSWQPPRSWPRTRRSVG